MIGHYLCTLGLDYGGVEADWPYNNRLRPYSLFGDRETFLGYAPVTTGAESLNSAIMPPDNSVVAPQSLGQQQAL